MAHHFVFSQIAINQVQSSDLRSIPHISIITLNHLLCTIRHLLGTKPSLGVIIQLLVRVASITPTRLHRSSRVILLFFLR
jgi:hypothetical protein